MSEYRFLATHILTGAVLGDWLPMITQSAARNINAIGAYTGALNLAAGTVQETVSAIAALEPERAVLWVFQDSVPVWVGIVWDWPHQSILDNTLPVSCSTMESLFQKRLISDNLTFTDIDVFDLFRALASYALSKTPNGQVAGFILGTNKAGVTTSANYVATDLKTVYDAWGDLVAAFNFEYSIRPGVDPASGALYMQLDLGYPELGIPLASAGLAYNMPGNLLDYQFTRTGSTSSNRVIATAPVQGTLTALNANPSFGSGTSPWAGINGATLAQNTSWPGSGTDSMQVTGNGFTANPAAQSEAIPVTPGTAYTLSAELNSVSGWTALVVAIQWYTAGSALISTSASTAVSLAANTSGPAVVNATAPAAAATARALVELSGTPSAGVDAEASAVVFSTARPGAGNWESQLPHGEDDTVLGLGYPLLESSASLSTVTVTSQAQIDGYADGLLPAVTGTQLTPMLTLAAGQFPAAKDTVLGSYCTFSATSALHPAGPAGEPGLQVTARVTGWALFPPSDQQQEHTQIQLGEIEFVT